MNDTPSSQPPVQPPTPTLAPAPTPGSPPDAQVRQWAMFCHLSALVGLIVPFGTILGPLLVWLIKKNELPAIDQHGKDALNFQITVGIASVALGIVGGLTLAFCVGIVFLILAVLIGLAGLIFAILNGIKANNGEPYKYPYSLKLVS
jgi:uncharacterized Tic20 family protein